MQQNLRKLYNIRNLTNKNMQKLDIIIIGNGIVGTLLALKLAKAGLSSALLADSKARIKKLPTPLIYALSPAQIPLLSKVDIWQKILPHTTPINEMIITIGDEVVGPASSRLHLDHADLDKGALAYNIEDKILRDALGQATTKNAPNMIQCISSKIKKVVQDSGGVQVALEDSTLLKASLLIIANGRSRKYAEQFGFIYKHKSYHQHAIVARIDHELPHDNIAHQIFTPLGPLAILPMPNHAGKFSSVIVWSLPTPRAQMLQNARVEYFMAALRPIFGDFRKNIKLASERTAFELKKITVNMLAQKRIAIIGDAAHIIHPLAGQGLNLGIGDASALSDIIIQASQRGEDIGRCDILERFCTMRRSDIMTLTTLTDGLHHAFLASSPLRQKILNIGMHTLAQRPFLRHMLTRYATGVMGGHHTTITLKTAS